MKTIVVGNNPNYIHDCKRMLDGLDMDEVSFYSRISDARTSVGLESPDLVISDFIGSDSREWHSFIAELRAKYIPVAICSDVGGDTCYKKALELGADAFFPLSSPHYAFWYYMDKKLLFHKENKQTFLLIKHNKIIIKVPAKSIHRIKTQGNYSFVFTLDGKKYIIKKSLIKILDTLDKSIIVQCHRSNAVNISKLKEFDSSRKRLVMSNGDVVDLGSNFKKQIRLAMARR